MSCCPACDCKVAYQYGDDERLMRCASCRHVFDFEDWIPDDDDDETDDDRG